MLTSREERMKLLERRVAELEQKLSEELKCRDISITELNMELESKSNTIAYLTQQLHQAKVKLKEALEDTHRLTQVQRETLSTASLPQRRLGSPSDAKAVQSSTPRACRTFRRTSSSPVPQDIQTHLSSGNTTLMAPSPRLAPRPPSTGSPSHPLLQRRASNNLRRRWSHSPKTSGSTSAIGSYSPTPPPRPPSLTPRGSTKALCPVSMHRHPSTPPDVTDILDNHQETRAREVQLAIRPSPPVLPPIQSENSVLDRHRGRGGVIPNQPGMVMPSQSVDHIHQSEVSRLQHPQQHRHFVLAQAQGLSSAPSTLRVLRYNALSRGGMEGGSEGIGMEVEGEEEENEEEEEEEAMEGRLLVRESINRKEQAWQELHQHGAD